ncbi:MAG: flagellin lysine-N-methylase [Clostridia bacterium]|nr:flagellin lysine-N-methylase [Clostridia bacterium]
MEYYRMDGMEDFRCLAGHCQHTWCRGGVITVDEDSAARFAAYTGKLGERLRSALARDEDGDWTFTLDEQENCPFLNGEGLCDLILEKGEGALCQICRDHPRYVNEMYTRVEYGLGMVCEAAAASLVHRVEPLCLVPDGVDGEEPLYDPAVYGSDDRTERDAEAAVLAARDRYLRIAQARDLPFEERIQRLRNACGAKEDLVSKAAGDFLLTLETLDSAWPETVKATVKGVEKTRWPEALAIPLEQILCACLFRHMRYTGDGRAPEVQLMLALFLTELTLRVALVQEDANADTLADALRRVSGEIEYSDINTEALLDFLEDDL